VLLANVEGIPVTANLDRFDQHKQHLVSRGPGTGLYTGFNRSGNDWKISSESRKGLATGYLGHGFSTNIANLEQLTGASERVGRTLDVRLINYGSRYQSAWVIDAVRHGLDQGVKVFSCSMAFRPASNGERVYEQISALMESYGAVFVGHVAAREVDTAPNVIKVAKDRGATKAGTFKALKFITSESSTSSGAIAIVAGRLAALRSLRPTASVEDFVDEVGQYASKTANKPSAVHGEIDFGAALEAFDHQPPLSLEERVTRLEGRVDRLVAA